VIENVDLSFADNAAAISGPHDVSRFEKIYKLAQGDDLEMSYAGVDRRIDEEIGIAGEKDIELKEVVYTRGAPMAYAGNTPYYAIKGLIERMGQWFREGKLRQGYAVYDLGSGMAARYFPLGCLTFPGWARRWLEFIGRRVEACRRIAQKLGGLARVDFMAGDALMADIDDADILYFNFYLDDDMHARMMEKIKAVARKEALACRR